MLINRLVITWKYKKYICINIGINSLLLGDATWCHKTCSSFSSDNGLWLIRHQALTWTNADSLAIEPLGTNREIWIKIQAFSLAKKWVLKWRLQNGSQNKILFMPQCVHSPASVCRFLWNYPSLNSGVLCQMQVSRAGTSDYSGDPL